MKLPKLPFARIVVLVPTRLAGNRRDDGTPMGTESRIETEFTVPVTADAAIDFDLRTVTFGGGPKPELAEHGVAVSAWHQSRGWHEGKYYSKPTWRFFDANGEEVSWKQFLDRYHERYPDLEYPDVTFEP